MNTRSSYEGENGPKRAGALHLLGYVALVECSAHPTFVGA